MGYACSSNMSTVSERSSRRHCITVLPYNAQMVSEHLIAGIAICGLVSVTGRKWPQPVVLKPIEDGKSLQQVLNR